MKTIMLELDDDLAEKLSKVSREKRNMLLKIWVERIVSSTKSLSDLLEFSALQAKKQGLTLSDDQVNALIKKDE